MNTIAFSFVLHNHQPLGNFDWVIEDSCKRAYLPFLKAVERHPGVRVGIHNTGILLEWYLQHHPEYIELLKHLVKRGQVELLTGTYYEAILPSIPDFDKTGQIRKLSTFISDLFGVIPRGMWVAERVWEPGLVKPLAEAGVEYVYLDDSHFQLAGLSEQELVTHFVTEDQGASVCVIPINQPLRHSIPFDPAEKPVELLRTAAEQGSGKWLSFADDGEKLGSWPETYEWVYERGWIARFFELIETSPWIQMKLPSEAVAQYKPGGIVYLPDASYSEMLKWSGGFWRNFLRRYPESNWMQKRMLHLSSLVPETGDAREEVWKSQCNCPYWHGVFGGLYLPHLRRETYTHLIKAEIAAGASQIPEMMRKDIDYDGHEEIILRNKFQALYLKPAQGGAAVEWDICSKELNLINTLSRRPEAYHAELMSEMNERDLISYDWYLHRSFIDHFLQDGSTSDGFAACSYGEQGDFVVGEYQVEESPFTLWREGGVWIGNRHCRVRVSKQINLVDTGIQARYEVRNLENCALELWFGIEMNYSMSAGEGEGCFYRIPAGGPVREPLNAVKSHFDIQSAELVDEQLGIAVNVSWDRSATLWHCAVETLSRSERGVDRIYQSSVLLPNWRIRLEPGCSWNITLQNTPVSL